MIIHNRKKRAEFFSEQKAKHQAAIHDSKQAIDQGLATEAQIEFLSREQAEDARVEELKKKKLEKKGMFKSATDWLFSGLKKEEEGEDVGSSEARLGYESLSEEDDGLGERESDIVRAIEDKKIAMERKATQIKEQAQQAFADEKERQRAGGPLDRLGTSSENTSSGEEPPKSGGWTSFMTRR